MTHNATLAVAAGLQSPARHTAVQAALQQVQQAALHSVRVYWADLHGNFRSKALVTQASTAALADAFDNGIGLVGTVLLKDSGDRTALPVFETAPEATAQGHAAALQGLQGAANISLLPNPGSLQALPWAPHTAWLRADAMLPNGQTLAIDPRTVLQRALALLQARGFALHCGLELEFHIHRIVNPRLASSDAEAPAEPPDVALLHPGYKLLGDDWADAADDALAIVRHTALGLNLPLRSLEIELGPSQFEAVFDPLPALQAADAALLFRNGVRQALRRAGYHASFVCRPPLPHSVASGWHLHHSLLDAAGGNAFAPAAGEACISTTGRQWLAGLLAHAGGLTALCAPTLLAYGRYRGSVMAPQAAVWGIDNRGAMLRVAGTGPATRIENRLAEPMANPHLMMAAHIHAGLDGINRALDPGPPCTSPYATGLPPLPPSLPEALNALAQDGVLQQGLGKPMAQLYQAVKQQELDRAAAAPDRDAWLRREYFARY